MNHKNRNLLIDFYKGMLMFGVIWGHTITALRAGEGKSVWILTFFRTYDMPFFMLLSGYFLARSLKKRPWRQEFIKKIRYLMLPVLLWEIIIGIWGPLFDSFHNLFSLWFLWSAIGCALIMIIVYGIIKNIYVQILTALLICIIFHLTDLTPFNLGYMFPFFVFGFYLETLYMRYSINIKKFIYLISFFSFIVLQCFWSGQYNIWNAGSYLLNGNENIIYIIFIRGMIGITGCATMKLVFDAFYLYFCSKCKSIVKFMINVGENTMLLYIFQSVIIEKFLSQIVLGIAGQLGYNPIVYNNGLLGYVFAPSIALVVIIIELNMIKLIKKMPRVATILT